MGRVWAATAPLPSSPLSHQTGHRASQAGEAHCASPPVSVSFVSIVTISHEFFCAMAVTKKQGKGE